MRGFELPCDAYIKDRNDLGPSWGAVEEALPGEGHQADEDRTETCSRIEDDDRTLHTPEYSMNKRCDLASILQWSPNLHSILPPDIMSGAPTKPI